MAGASEYPTLMKTTLSTKGQIILPVVRIGRGEYRLKRKARRRNEGLVKLLLACPVKGWFKPMGRSKTTYDIKD